MIEAYLSLLLMVFSLKGEAVLENQIHIFCREVVYESLHRNFLVQRNHQKLRIFHFK